MMKRLGLFVLAALPLAAATPPPDPDEGMEGSIRLSIPEPMVFDLVRPLGAAKGEFEINTLFLQPFRQGQRPNWAPEVEYAFAEGSAVEFEMPVEGWQLATWKFGLQQKLPFRPKWKITHGLQGLGEIGQSEPGWSVAGLYILGVRWHPHWSTLSMVGAKHETFGEKPQTAPLINHTLFYERWKVTAIGLELNSKLARASQSSVLLMPQLHVRLGRRINLQCGAGYQREPQMRSAAISFRLIREL